ncbi:hypothetical protein Tco_0968652 [Tanacetum coccineum]
MTQSKCKKRFLCLRLPMNMWSMNQTHVDIERAVDVGGTEKHVEEHVRVDKVIHGSGEEAVLHGNSEEAVKQGHNKEVVEETSGEQV